MPLPQIRVVDVLSEPEAAQVRDLHVRAASSDGVAPLSEQSLLALEGPRSGVRHLLAYGADAVTGYAQLDGVGSEQAGPPSGELVVAPDARGQGVGSALLAALVDAAPQVRVWSHGNLPPARALAASAGLTPVRELHKMSRALSEADARSAATALPAGFAARAFRPGQDEEPWLATNAAAFAHHAEQGRLTLTDLQERMAQEWFDPAGFILVEAQDAPGQVAAFHWTKVDPLQESSLAPGRTAGEVYVVGVHPAYQGRGLGRPLTALGLAHLAGLGLPEVVLYVDGDNQAAIRTYTGLGFRSIMVDVMYSRHVHP